LFLHAISITSSVKVQLKEMHKIFIIYLSVILLGLLQSCNSERASNSVGTASTSPKKSADPLKLYKEGLYNEAYKILIAKVEKLTPEEQEVFGSLFLHGLGVKQDLVEAQRWLRASALRGHAKANSLLGYMYENGLGVPQSFTQAKNLYRKAANSGDPLGMNNLGHLYDKGKGVTQDQEIAFKWYDKAAQRGDNSALNNAGWALVNGLGTEQNVEKGIEYLKLSANKGNTLAMRNLGTVYGNLPGEENTKRSRKWMKEYNILNRSYKKTLGK